MELAGALPESQIATLRARKACFGLREHTIGAHRHTDNPFSSPGCTQILPGSRKSATGASKSPFWHHFYRFLACIFAYCSMLPSKIENLQILRKGHQKSRFSVPQTINFSMIFEAFSMFFLAPLQERVLHDFMSSFYSIILILSSLGEPTGPQNRPSEHPSLPKNRLFRHPPAVLESLGIDLAAQGRPKCSPKGSRPPFL